MLYKKILFSFLFALGLNTAIGNNVDSISKLFPGELAVFTKYNEHLIISFENDHLVSNSSIEREMLLLSDKANSIFNSSTIFHSFLNPISNLEGFTILPKELGGKKIKAQSIATKPSLSNAVFYDDTKESVVSFTNLTKGSITQVKYNLTHKDIHMLPRFYFQNYVPTLQSKFSVTYPKGVEIAGVLQGTEVNWIKTSTTETKKTITITWEANPAPKGQLYTQAPSFATYAPHVVVYVKNYTKPKTNERISVLDNTAALYQFISSFVAKINQQPNAAITAKTTEITAKSSSAIEKAAAIYQWVQSNIRYVAFEDSLGGFVPREAALVYNRRFGDCKDMTSLLRSMCIAAGLDARYVWVGTRDIAYNIRNLPVPAAFNHMICAVKINNQWVFMDGTEPVLPFGQIPHALQEKEALLYADDGAFEVVTIPVSPLQSNQLIDSSVVNIANSDLKGTLSIHTTGYYAANFNGALKYKNENDKEKFFKSLTQRGNNKYIQNGFDFKAAENKNEVMVNAQFTLPDYIRSVGKEYYVNLHLNKILPGTKMDTTEQRIAPIEQEFLNRKKQIVKLEIPTGYTASHLPESVTKNFEGVGSFSVQYTQTDDYVILVKEMNTTSLTIAPAQFDTYNQMIDALQLAYKASVVLSPKQP